MISQASQSTTASKCGDGSNRRGGPSCTKTKVHGYKSPTVVQFKGNKCPRCMSVFASEKSANDHYRRNLRRKSCAKPRGSDVSHVPSRRSAPSPPKNKGKRGRKRLCTQQTLFGVFGFENQGDRGENRNSALAQTAGGYHSTAICYGQLFHVLQSYGDHVKGFWTSWTKCGLSNHGDCTSDTSRQQHTGWNGVNSWMVRYVVFILMA